MNLRNRTSRKRNNHRRARGEGRKRKQDIEVATNHELLGRTKAFTLSTRAMAFSNLSKRFLFSISRRSSTATRSSSLARALRSCATISFAWLNSCTVKSSNSVFACVSCFSAAFRRPCSRSSASCSSALSLLAGEAVCGSGVIGAVGVDGTGAEAEVGVELPRR